MSSGTAFLAPTFVVSNNVQLSSWKLRLFTHFTQYIQQHYCSTIYWADIVFIWFPENNNFNLLPLREKIVSSSSFITHLKNKFSTRCRSGSSSMFWTPSGQTASCQLKWCISHLLLDKLADLTKSNRVCIRKPSTDSPTLILKWGLKT